MTAKHTAGPWKVWKGHTEVFAEVGKNTMGEIKGFCIARCDPDDIDLPNIADADEGDRVAEQIAAANARLISTAPELLAFVEDQMKETNCICRLKKLVNGTHLETDLECTKCRAQALILKAKGGKS